MLTKMNNVCILSLFTNLLIYLLLLQYLDEVQSYIIVERAAEKSNLAFDSMLQELVHVVSGFLLFPFVM